MEGMLSSRPSTVVRRCLHTARTASDTDTRLSPFPLDFLLFSFSFLSCFGANRAYLTRNCSTRRSHSSRFSSCEFFTSASIWLTDQILLLSTNFWASSWPALCCSTAFSKMPVRYATNSGASFASMPPRSVATALVFVRWSKDIVPLSVESSCSAMGMRSSSLASAAFRIARSAALAAAWSCVERSARCVMRHLRKLGVKISVICSAETRPTIVDASWKPRYFLLGLSELKSNSSTTESQKCSNKAQEGPVSFSFLLFLDFLPFSTDASASSSRLSTGSHTEWMRG
mmetsp:Transcript_22217/g.87535  ORF Transcript_22217/g.87535 Transcript_22217/m.87535 type:complete len:286 (-) Transcript_22217:1102-1959(-)